tara:strand:- start:31 stop:327 length:297 start_codon:yes stop_codon:yes gene_type:complete
MNQFTNFFFVVFIGFHVPFVFAENLQTKYLASLCLSCHGSDKTSYGIVPSLSGYDSEKLINYFVQSAKPENKSSVMHKIAKGYTSEEIKSIANYFEKQ